MATRAPDGANNTFNQTAKRTAKKFKDFFVFLFVVKDLYIEIAKSRNSIEDNILRHRKILGSLSQSN